ncbi:hypothetical protein H4W26_001207 [Nesterenkonia halotolerans]|uniref:Uncharacterized protein n=1 Tax=Nesterenkonia halotolerans TaxID=225325 RepID=A0ABR9J6H0_9MICC|nr:hypothetical protein [Nesterenkonia halotolerans]MBE1514452.1 hypothetical protein [Nesterenkonia halotolerans]
MFIRKPLRGQSEELAIDSAGLFDLDGPVYRLIEGLARDDESMVGKQCAMERTCYVEYAFPKIY